MKTRTVFIFLEIVLFISISLLVFLPASFLRPAQTVTNLSLGNGHKEIGIFGEIDLSNPYSYPNDISISINRIGLTSSIFNNANKVCFKTVRVFYGVETEEYYVSDMLGQGLDNTDYCMEYFVFNERSETYSNEETLRTIEVNLPEFNLSLDELTNASFFRYPYDNLSISLLILVSYFSYDEANKLIDTNSLSALQNLDVNSSGWNVVQNEPGSEMILKKPLVLRIIVPVLLFFLICITISLLFVEEFSSTLGISAAIILGILGIRQIILPSTFPGITGIDIFIIGIFFGIFIALLKFLIKQILNYFASRPKETESHPYIGLRHTKIYHKYGCKLIKNSNADSTIYFRSKAEAENSGRVMCSRCANRTE